MQKLWIYLALLLAGLTSFAVYAGVRQTVLMNRGAAMAFAASRNDVVGLRRMIREGYEVNNPVYKGRSPLYWAVLRGNHAAMRLLLDAGERPDPRERTQLRVIAQNNHDAEALRLLDRAASPVGR